MLPSHRLVAVLAIIWLTTVAACASDDPASTEAPTTTEPPATTEAPTTAESPANTNPPATVVDEPESSTVVGALDFNRDSDPVRNPSVFGYSAFDEVDEAAMVEEVSETLGDADDDTDWIPMPDAYACNGASEYRSLLWNDIRFVLTRQSVDPTATYLSAWSIGDAALALSPPLDTEIAESSGITTIDGIGLGTPADRLDDVSWAQSLRKDDRFLGLAGNGPVVFRLDASDLVVAMSYERNDC